MSSKDANRNSVRRSRRRTRFAVATLVGAVLLGLGLYTFWSEPPEPVFEGKRLSQWLEETAPGGTLQQRLRAVYSPFHGTPELPREIKAFGRNGIPFYVKWVSYKPGLLQKTKKFLQKHAVSRLNISWQPFDEEAVQACAAFTLVSLGDEAIPAIPGLCHIAISHAPSEPPCQYATEVLGTLAKPKQGYLRTRFLTALDAHLSALFDSPDPEIRMQTTNLVERLSGYNLSSPKADILW